MTVEVEIDGRAYRVQLERTGQRWTATVGNRTLAVDAARTPAGWSLLIGSPGSHDGSGPNSYDVAIDEGDAGDMIAHVNGHAIQARVTDPRRWHRRQDRGAGANAGTRTVTSAMPGRVVKVLVSAGERVAARQGLVVVEAMKMENELRAPADAIVREVRAVEGTSVDAGAILVVLE